MRLSNRTILISIVLFLIFVFFSFTGLKEKDKSKKQNKTFTKRNTQENMLEIKSFQKVKQTYKINNDTELLVEQKSLDINNQLQEKQDKIYVDNLMEEKEYIKIETSFLPPKKDFVIQHKNVKNVVNLTSEYEKEELKSLLEVVYIKK